MVGVVHDCLGHERWRTNAFEGGNSARALPWTVHAACIELHDSISVRETSEPDARIFRIELDDIDARDESVQDITAACKAPECFLNTGCVAAVLVSVSIARCNDDRPDRRRDYRRRLTGLNDARASERDASQDSPTDEIASTDTRHSAPPGVFRRPLRHWLSRWPLKAEVIPIRIRNVQLLHAVVGDDRLLHSDPLGVKILARGINIRTVEVESRVVMRVSS
jgi:hypothetical protein